MDTATTDTDVRNRIEKAQSEQMEIHIVSDSTGSGGSGTSSSPINSTSGGGSGSSSHQINRQSIIEVDNQTSDTTHAIVPEQLYCSCEDHRYRNAVCKHMLFVMLQAQDFPNETPLGSIGTTMRDRLTTRLNELEKQEAQLQDQMNDVESEIDALSSARRAVQSKTIDGPSSETINGPSSETTDSTQSETDDDAASETTTVADLFDR